MTGFLAPRATPRPAGAARPAAPAQRRRARLSGVCAGLAAAALAATCHAGTLDMKNDVLPVLLALKEQPLDRESLITLPYLYEAADGAANRDVKAGLMTIYGLGQAASGEQKEGAETCRKVLAQFKGSEFLPLASQVQAGRAASVESLRTTLRDAIRRTTIAVNTATERARVTQVKMNFAFEGMSATNSAPAEQRAVSNFVAAVLTDPVTPPGRDSQPLDVSDVPMLDALVHACRRPGFKDLSVDPELTAHLTETKVPLSLFAAATNTPGMAETIRKHGLVLLDIAVTNTLRVSFLTTPPAQAYSAAAQFLREDYTPGAVLKAQAPLRGARSPDAVPFAAHAAGLLDALTAMQAVASGIDACKVTVLDSVKLLGGAQRSIESSLTRIPFKMVTSDPDGKLAAKAAAQRDAIAIRLLENAQKSMTAALAHLKRAYAEQVPSYARIVGRINESYAANLTGECIFLLDGLTANAAQMRAACGTLLVACDQMRKACEAFQQNPPAAAPAGGATALANVVQIVLTDLETWSAELKRLPAEDGYVPPEAARWMASLRAELIESEYGIDAAVRLVRSDKPGAALAFAGAVASDRSSLRARAGQGYCTLQSMAESLNRAFSTRVSRPTLSASLAGEFKQRGKPTYLDALHEVTFAVTPRAEPAADAGLAPGSVLCPAADGAVQIAVAFAPVNKRTAVIGAERRTPWSGIVFNQAALASARLAATLGEDGPEVSRLWMALGQAFPWISQAAQDRLDPAPAASEEGEQVILQTERGIEVRFPDAVTQRHAGEAAMLPIGLAVFSAGSATNLSASAAFAGALLADGSLRRIGRSSLMATSVAGASRIEVIILPRENESDLLLVPPEALCRVAIVLAGSIDDCKPYALNSPETGELLGRLARAQLRFAAGRVREATRDLREISGRAPNIYTARRLLELAAYAGE